MTKEINITKRTKEMKQLKEIKKSKKTDNKQNENKSLYSNFFTLKNYYAPNECHNLYFSKIDKIQAITYNTVNRGYIDNRGNLQQKNWCEIDLKPHNVKIDTFKDSGNDNRNIRNNRNNKNDDENNEIKNLMFVNTDINDKGFCLYVKNGDYEDFRDWLNYLVMFYNAYTSEDEIGDNEWDCFKIIEE